MVAAGSLIDSVHFQLLLEVLRVRPSGVGDICTYLGVSKDVPQRSPSSLFHSLPACLFPFCARFISFPTLLLFHTHTHTLSLAVSFSHAHFLSFSHKHYAFLIDKQNQYCSRLVIFTCVACLSKLQYIMQYKAPTLQVCSVIESPL